MYVGETTYRAKSWKKSRRIVVVRKEEAFCDGYIYQAAVITRSGGRHTIHFTNHSPLQHVDALLEAS